MSFTLKGLPSSILTSFIRGTQRLKVDSQQTSYEENRQFRFFEDNSLREYKDPPEDATVGSGEILVYRVTTTNPVTLQSRGFNGWLGGRKYVAFPVDGNETITGGTWQDVSNKITRISTIPQPDLPNPLPATGVTIERRIATAFTTTTEPVGGSVFKSDSNANKATAATSPSGGLAGISGGSAFYLVLFPLGGDADFMAEIAWEETFSETP